MPRRFVRCVIALCAMLGAGASASAAPPSSCAAKFVGTWAYPGGVTVIHRDGTANPRCPACVAVQNWTCDGITYLFSNGGPPGQFTATLTDRNTLVGSGVTATRVSRGR